MDLKDVIEQRRAVNFFDPDRDVSPELLRQMIELAAKAPSGFNLQPWSLMILRDKERKERLKKHAWGQAKISEAPVTMIVLADTDGWKENHRFAEKDFNELLKSGEMTEERRGWFFETCATIYGASEARQVAFACKNTGFFGMSLMLAAKHLGLDTHPMDGFDIDAVRREFAIADNYWIMMLLAVGYFHPEKTLFPPKWRKTYEEIVIEEN